MGCLFRAYTKNKREKKTIGKDRTIIILYGPNEDQSAEIKNTFW